MNFRRTISAVGLSAFALAGCSTSYAPKPHPRVAIVMQGGTPVYIREGRVFPGGGFGGDLREAVEGNPEAEEHAKSYRTNMIAGVSSALVGIASAVAGSAMYIGNSTGPENERDSTAQAIGGTMAVSGVLAYATGMFLMLNAQPHLWDAVNAYNDGVDAGSTARLYGTHVAPVAAQTPLGTSSGSVAHPPESSVTGGATEKAKQAGASPALAPTLPGVGPNAAAPAPIIELNLDDLEEK
ncbi:MAG: hypothetical protein ABW133_24505 [Polyangiaceae bacterium]